MKLMLLLLSFAFLSCKNTYYIVRHAEKEGPKAGMSVLDANDPPLSAAGHARADQLAQTLSNKKIQQVFSTKYKRTRSTVAPLCKQLGLTTQVYPASLDSMNAFIARLKSIRKGNVLIAGHSNTIDDIANKLVGGVVVPADLPESEYNNIFIVTRKGKRYHFSRITYGN